MIKIDLTKLSTKTATEDVRLNSPRNVSSSIVRGGGTEVSKTARSAVPPPVSHLQVPKSARAKLGADNSVYHKMQKHAVQLNRIDIFPAGVDFNNNETDEPQQTNKYTNHSKKEISGRNIAKPKPPSIVGGDSVILNGAETSTSATIKSNAAKATTTIKVHEATATATATTTSANSWGKFPQRNVLKKATDHVPDRLLLSRQYVQWEQDVGLDQPTRISCSPPHRPNTSKLKNTIELELAGMGKSSERPFESHTLSPKPETVLDRGADHIIFIPSSSSPPAYIPSSSALAARATNTTTARYLQPEVNSAMMVTGVNNSDNQFGCADESAPGSRSSVRVKLPSVPRKTSPLLPVSSESAPLTETTYTDSRVDSKEIEKYSQERRNMKISPVRISRVITGPTTNSVTAAAASSSTGVAVLPPTEVTSIATSIYLHAQSRQKHNQRYNQKQNQKLCAPVSVRTISTDPPYVHVDEAEMERELALHLNSIPLNEAHNLDEKRGHSPIKSQQQQQQRPASYVVQELTVPTMPFSPRAQSRSIDNHALANNKHRSLMTKVHRRTVLSSPMNDSPDKVKVQSHQSGLGVGGIMPEGSPLKRRHIKDSLNGVRTNAISGGILMYEGTADFHDLMAGTNNVSAAVMRFSESSPSAGAGSVESPRQKLVAAAPSATAPLSPVALAAIEAARTASAVDLSGRTAMRALSPASAIEQFPSHFGPISRIEVMKYPKVYFLGYSEMQRSSALNRLNSLATAEPVLIHRDPVDVTALDSSNELHDNSASLSNNIVNDRNHGFDDPSGSYRVLIGDQVRYRYEILKPLGKGSFGEVYRCRDHKSSVDVAVKIIKNQPVFSAQADKELAVLRMIIPEEDKQKSENTCSASLESFSNSRSTVGVNKRHNHFTIQLVDSFQFRDHKCFVFPVFGKNLYEYIKEKDFAGLPMSFVRRVAVQLLHALKHLKTLNIVHCDIKPENILIREEGTAEIVLIDFGSSCVVSEQTFSYIQSRFYRAPEVLLGLRYGVEIDLWSVASLLPELRSAYPAFPGESGPDQLACVAEVIGLPPREFIERSPRKDKLFSENGELCSKVSPRGLVRVPGSRTLEGLCNARRRDADFVDFLSRTLRWLPEKRMSIEEALEHSWLRDFGYNCNSSGNSRGGSATVPIASQCNTPDNPFPPIQPNTSAATAAGNNNTMTGIGIGMLLEAPEPTKPVPPGASASSVDAVQSKQEY